MKKTENDGNGLQGSCTQNDEGTRVCDGRSRNKYTIDEEGVRIYDGREKKYLDEIMDDLPDNVRFNKKVTGCGMTSVALENDVRYVVVMPYVSLVKNKSDWCKDKNIEHIAIHGTFSRSREKLQKFEGNKILCTYDSFKKVTDILEQRGQLQDWKCLIDESHQLVTGASFRGSAMWWVMETYNRYGRFVFGTATPIIEETQMEALKKMPMASINWGKLDTVKVRYTPYKESIYNVTTILAMNFIEGKESGNAHIFINTVRGMTQVIKMMEKGLKRKVSGDVRIVCANTDKNKKFIKSRLSKGYVIEPVGSKVKKINLYTSTAFEGADIWDEEGKNFIMTDGTRDSTKIDITTLLVQIIGRVRDSKYKNVVDLMYSGELHESYGISKYKYIKIIEEHLKKAEITVDTFKNMKCPLLKQQALERNENHPYLVVVDGRLEVNTNAMHCEMNAWETINRTYTYKVLPCGKIKRNMEGTKKINGRTYEYIGTKEIDMSGVNKIRIGKVANFKHVCLQYEKALAMEKGMLRTQTIKNIKELCELVHEAYTKLGQKKVIALGRRKCNIQKALIAINNKDSIDIKMVKRLKLRNNKWTSNEKIKKAIQDCYDLLGLGITAKATDVNKWYITVQRRRTIDGKQVHGFIVHSARFRITS